MNVLDQLKRWLGLQPALNPQALALRQMLESGRRAKHAEDYAAARAAFTRALEFTQTYVTARQDEPAINIIRLHQADIYIRQGSWDEAEHLLETIQQAARPESAHFAYTLDVRGTLAQARGDAAQARAYFEQALAAAKSAHAQGAQGRALGHLAELYLDDGNASYATHLLKEALPLLNASGDIELSSHFVGLLGEAQIASGQETEGETMLTRALRLAEQMHYRLYKRRWRLALGAQAARSGHYSEARAHYQHALELFADLPPTAHYLHAEIDTLCKASQVALNLSDHNEGLRLARRAFALAEEHQTALALAQGALGMALRAAGNNSEALPYLQAAAYENDDADIAVGVRVSVLRSLAAAQSETQAAIDEAAATYKQAIMLAQKAHAPNEQAQAQRDLGLLYWSKKMIQQALGEWTAALHIYQDEHLLAQAARLYCDIATARKALGQGQRAMRDYEQALMLLNSVNDLETRGVVLSNAATAYAEMGDVDSADDFFSESINIAHKLSDFRAEATRRGNHGWFLLATGRARRATNVLEQALQISRVQKLELQVAVQTDNLGLAHDELHEYEVALHYHRQALTLIQALQPPPPNQAYWENLIKSNTALTAARLGHYDEAAALIAAALAYGREHENAEISARALLAAARSAFSQKQTQAAGEHLAEALTLARRSEIRFLIALTLEAYSEQQAQEGHVEKANALWAEAQKLFAMMHNPRARSQPTWLLTPKPE
ncbi:MAG: hypothetical protein HXY40_07850 [Chloroflexi bacterium]|nr:hypothetical protein [Chloroflexota bacterium]